MEDVSGQCPDTVRTVEKELEAVKSRLQRRRPRLHITISEENYRWLKENVSNISDFIDKLVEAAKSGLRPYAGVIPKTNTGREGFEPPTAGLRVPRSTWLSYRPLEAYERRLIIKLVMYGLCVDPNFSGINGVFVAPPTDPGSCFSPGRERRSSK